jgi:uncharacterized damage-inducible protein DinB
MSGRSLAAWVESIAYAYHDAHAEAIERARTLSDADLAKPTGDSGWSVRDELAHMAAADGDFVRTLSAVINGEQVDFRMFDNIDERNAHHLAGWSDRPREDIVAELDRHDGELQELLTRLTPEDEARTPDGFPFPLAQMLQGYAMHHPYHLEQIAGALAGHPLQG